MLRIPTHVLMRGPGDGSVLVDVEGLLPSVDLELDEDETVIIGVERALRSVWKLAAVVLETHLPPTPGGTPNDRVALAVIDGPDSSWIPPAGTRWAETLREMPERVGERAATWLRE